MEMEKWLDISELSKILKVKKSWLYQKAMCKGPGSISEIKIVKMLRFDPDAVERWILKKNT
jgi:hypothetical protein